MKCPADPRIDACISNAEPFAQPILTHLRELVHRACPAAIETIKWGMPHFEYNGSILCSMAAFKAHCAFGFWHQGMKRVMGADGAKAESAMGSLGRITQRSDLPDDRAMVGYIRAAMKLIDSGAPARPKPAASKSVLAVPDDLAAAFRKNAAAGRTFREFRPSHQREYVEWIVEAKRPETRQRRLATTLEWLAAGRPRNWKYESC